MILPSMFKYKFSLTEREEKDDQNNIDEVLKTFLKKRKQQKSDKWAFKNWEKNE